MVPLSSMTFPNRLIQTMIIHIIYHIPSIHKLISTIIPNFHFHLSLDRKDPVADAQGVKYYEGFAVNCIRDTYLKDHEAPEDCEYYLCGPPMLIKTVTDYLDSLGVDPESIMYDNFG